MVIFHSYVSLPEGKSSQCWVNDSTNFGGMKKDVQATSEASTAESGAVDSNECRIREWNCGASQHWFSEVEHLCQ